MDYLYRLNTYSYSFVSANQLTILFDEDSVVLISPNAHSRKNSIMLIIIAIEPVISQAHLFPKFIVQA